MTPQEIIDVVNAHEDWLAEKPNGARADLALADLRGFDFTSCNLRSAKMMGANLESCDISNGNLAEIDAFGACFARSDLTDSNFYRADLRGADFRGAKLHGTVLREADLRRGTLFNWTGDKLRKEGNEQGEVPQVQRGFQALPVNVNRVAHGLKRIK